MSLPLALALQFPTFAMECNLLKLISASMLHLSTADGSSICTVS